MESAQITALLDPVSALVVLGGAALATVLRCGWHDCKVAAGALRIVFQPRYTAAAGKAELAGQVRDIQADGLIGAAARPVHDAEFAHLTDAILHARSLSGLAAMHERFKAARVAQAETAVGVLVEAAELSPVFGMAGTLLALNAMPANPDATGSAIAAAIGMAVVTTLYGLLAANLLFAPLARLIQRTAAAEEAERQEVADWLAAQIAQASPPVHPRTRRHAA